MKEKISNIGIEVSPPKETCNDKHCPFHSGFKVKGRILTGKIIGGDVNNTSRVVFERLFYLQKYERYEKRKTALKVHNPPCIKAKKGDKVKFMECRPISKTKNFVILTVEK